MIDIVEKSYKTMEEGMKELDELYDEIFNKSSDRDIFEESQPEEYECDDEEDLHEDIVDIKLSIMEFVLLEDIREYSQLISVCRHIGPEYADVAVSYPTYCNKLCESYKRDPIRALFRYIECEDDPEKKETAKKKVKKLSENDPVCKTMRKKYEKETGIMIENKSSDTDDTQIMKDIFAFIDENQIDSFSDLIATCAIDYPDWFYKILAMDTNTYAVIKYIESSKREKYANRTE